MVHDLVNQAPKGYTSPSYEKMREIILSKEKSRIYVKLHDVREC